MRRTELNIEGVMKMDARLKRKWLKALRSGEYRQGRYLLVSDNGKNFCCLGVLADVMGCEWQESKANYDSSLVPILPRNKRPLARRGDAWMSPSKTGLSSKKQEKLAGMNDDGSSFKRIANFIEKNL